MLSSGEVEDDQFSLARRTTQAAPELLEKHRGTLGRAEEEQRVDVRNVDAFVVDVDHAQHLHPAGVEVATSASSFDAVGAAGHYLGRKATVFETAGDFFGVADVHAERDGAHLGPPPDADCRPMHRLSSVVSGPEAACKTIIPLMEVIAPQGVSYVGDGELARVCKIAHNVMLGVVIENLIEITLLVNKMGVPRHAFLAFLNNGVMGSMFTRYKSPALVNLDWTTTFTPELLRKDLDLGLELGREMDVPMPVTAATREVLQGHFGHATLQPDPQAYLNKDFAALIETMALAAGMKLTPENKNVPTGLES